MAKDKSKDKTKENEHHEHESLVKTVIALITYKESVLLIQRKHEPFAGSWALPGGHIDPGEKDEAAIIREVKEETGLTMKPEYFGSYDEYFPDINWHAIVSVFTGVMKRQQKLKQPDKKEIGAIKWVPFSDVDDLDMAFNHKRIVAEFIASQ